MTVLTIWLIIAACFFLTLSVVYYRTYKGDISIDGEEDEVWDYVVALLLMMLTSLLWPLLLYIIILYLVRRMIDK